MKPFALLALMFLAVAACEIHDVEPAPAIDRPPLLEKAPFGIGVHYAEELRHHRCAASKGYIAARYTFELGPESLAMFDNIFAGFFANVDKLQENPGKTPGTQDTISVQLAKFTGCDASWPILNTTSIEVIYDATIRSAAGKDIARVRGEGLALPHDHDWREHTYDAPEKHHLSALTRIAMRRAGASFVVEFERNPGVQAWLRRQKGS